MTTHRCPRSIRPDCWRNTRSAWPCRAIRCSRGTAGSSRAGNNYVGLFANVCAQVARLAWPRTTARDPPLSFITKEHCMNIRTFALVAICGTLVACADEPAPTDLAPQAIVIAQVAPTCLGQTATIYPGAPSLPAGASVTPIPGGGYTINGT